MVVDMTLARMPCLPTPEAHAGAAETLADALQGWRNVYFDLANERDQNYPGGGFVSYAELRALRRRGEGGRPGPFGDGLRDPVTARTCRDTWSRRAWTSSPLTSLAMRELNRGRRTPLESISGGMKELDRAAPIHYQEPFRRDYWTIGLLAAGGGDLLHRPAQRQARRRRGLVLPQREPSPPGVSRQANAARLTCAFPGTAHGPTRRRRAAVS